MFQLSLGLLHQCQELTQSWEQVRFQAECKHSDISFCNYETP